MSKKSHKGSLFYQLTNAAGLNVNANRKGGIATSFKTQSNYKKWLHYAADYFKSNGIRNAEQIDAAAIQRYSDHLCDKGYAASTVHAYLAPLCKACGVSMDKIAKPIRYVSEFSKCRTTAQNAAESDNKTIHLNSFLGFRRNELTRLRGNDLRQDRLGSWYVHLDRGKGGKAQHQYILPSDLEKVRPYFDGSDALLFHKTDMDPKYSYHSQRHALAKRCYDYYLQRLQENPGYRKQLYKTIAESWHRLNKRNRDELEPFSFFDREYALRGKNRALAQEKGKPVVYDRIALRAVSVLHLSHWRDNITIDYLLS